MLNIWGTVGGVQFALPMETLLGLTNQLLGMNIGATALQYKSATFNNATNQFALPVGALAAPSLTFTGDLNTGMYQDGADAVSIAVGGVRIVKMDGVANLISNFKNQAMSAALFMDDFGPDIVAGATTDLGTATGNVVRITNAVGATVVTSLGGATIPAGTVIETKFVITGGSITLTQDAVNLPLLGGANIALQSGDIARWRKLNDAAAQWEMYSFQRALLGNVIITTKGDLIVGADSGGGVIAATRKGVGVDGAILRPDSTQNDGLIWVPDYMRSLAQNPHFQINQRQPATNADGSYGHDMWYVLTAANPIAVTTRADAENGMPYMARLTQSNAVAQKFGYAQIFEGKSCKWLRGQIVTFRPRVQLSVAANVRYAILEWTGTEDNPTKDVVNNWASAVYTAGNFFLAANLVVTAVGSMAVGAGALTDLTALTGTIGVTMNNLYLFIWTEADSAQNVTLDIGKVRFNVGNFAGGNIYVPQMDEVLAMCQRFYEKTFGPTVQPAQAVAGEPLTLIATVVTAVANNLWWAFKVEKFRRGGVNTTGVTTFNPVAANANWRDTVAGADRTVIVQSPNSHGVCLIINSAPVVSNINQINATAESSYI